HFMLKKEEQVFAYCLRIKVKHCMIRIVYVEGANKLSNRQRALDEALRKIEKQFGKGSIMKLGEEAEQKIETISSGSLGLDIALGIGGYPRGRVVEIYGPESSGKTTVAL